MSNVRAHQNSRRLGSCVGGYYPDIMYRCQRYLALLTCVVATASTSAQPANLPSQRYPDVVAAKVQSSAGGVFNFDVTVSSPYDTPQRYADAIRVLSKDGAVLGQRILLHDHAEEQPFTRDLYGVTVPPGVRAVILEARDLKYGYGGKTVEVSLPGR
jgi:hypothetical protein